MCLTSRSVRQRFSSWLLRKLSSRGSTVAYIKLTRPHWFVASTLAAMIGIFHAWANGSYQLLLAVLVIVGVILHHAIMETWDELQDYANYREEMVTDSAGPPTLFSGGSGVLTGQLLTVRQVW